MTSTAISKLFKCDYLHLHTSPPLVFPSEQAELAHINEQISTLDNHISQLNSLRRPLHRRSCQLHNLLLPVHTLPIEVLSRILQQAVHPENRKYIKFEEYRKCLRQAFLLSSVSAHFRHVAFCTPELWRKIPLKITVAGAIGKVSSLLRHCMTFATSIKVAIDDQLDEKEVYSAVDTLLTSDATRKIKAVELFSRRASNIWIAILKGSPFPMLDTLSILSEDLNLDLRMFNTVTRFRIHHLGPHHPEPGYSTIVPSSVRYLYINNISPHALVSILYQCPNLEECIVYNAHHYCQVAQFDRHLTLAHLKHLTLDFFTFMTPDFVNVTMTPSSAQNLRLPSLEYLDYRTICASDLTGLLLLCRNVFATLMTLKINVTLGSVDYDNLHRLCGLPFPNLRELEFAFANSELMLSTIRELTQRAEECGMAQLHYLPSLATLTLLYDSDKMDSPRCLLDLLKKWRVGETSYFHLELKGFNRPGPGNGSLVGEEELRSIVGNRKIKVTWDSGKVQ